MTILKQEELLNTILAPCRDYVPKASPVQFEEFMKTVMYNDFLEEIKIRIEEMRDFYETCPKDKYLETKGALALLRVIGGIFTDLQHNAESALEPKKDGE